MGLERAGYKGLRERPCAVSFASGIGCGGNPVKFAPHGCRHVCQKIETSWCYSYRDGFQRAERYPFQLFGKLYFAT